MNLRRITTHGSWIPEIDGLRFIAIASTILVHIFNDTHYRLGLLTPAWERIAAGVSERGGRGVLLFFAISGFILAQPFLRQHLLHGKPVSVTAFFKRRLTRLEPPYILSLLLYAFADVVRFHHSFGVGLPLLAHIVYIHNFTNLPTLNFVTWSLEVEVQFYLLAPLLGLLYAIPSAIPRRALMLALIAASAAFHIINHSVARNNLPGQLQFFLIGFLLADLRATRSESQTSRWWDLLSLACWVAIFAVPTPLLDLTFPALILLAYLAAFNGPISRGFFRTPWIALTGGMCYSFYLMHMLILSSGLHLTSRFLVPSSVPLSFLIQLCILGPIIYLLCTGYYVLIERPCMDPAWPHKLALRVAHVLRPPQAKPAPEETEIPRTS